MNTRWVILVGQGYGAFFFQGTEAEAEAARKHKAHWERAIALKRPAADDETDGKVSQCWNHKNFDHVPPYACGCAECK